MRENTSATPQHVFSELAQYDLSAEAIQKLDISFCLENGIAVLDLQGPDDGTSTIGMLNPDNTPLFRHVEKLLGRPCRSVQLNDFEIRRALAVGYENHEPTDLSGHLQIDLDAQISFEPDQPASKIVDATLAAAIRRGASDIHIECYRDDVDLRFRIDGVLHQVTTPISPANVKSVISRIKVVAMLDVSVRRLPQDGRISLQVKDQGESRHVDLRISTLPGPYGESAVVRVLDPESLIIDITALGLRSGHEKKLRHALTKRSGIILISGPTGCGKTTTMYSCIRELVSPELKILTVEDPIEYEMPKINQHQISANLGFSEYARAFLRHDPDVLMIGEIRDTATAQLAIQAAMTGHLVLSTVHTNDAVSVVSRLRDLGISNHRIAEALQLAIAQRLLRRICSRCGGPQADGGGTYGILGKTSSCPQCGGIGYRGRCGVFELFAPDDAVRELIASGAGVAAIRAALAPEYVTMGMDATEKANRSLTDLREVKRQIVLG